VIEKGKIMCKVCDECKAKGIEEDDLSSPNVGAKKIGSSYTMGRREKNKCTKCGHSLIKVKLKQ
jgi:hypothetical protein